MEQCQGLKGNNGDCCHIRDKNWIIGKVKDDKELLARVQKEYDKNLTWNDLFIDYDEGSKMFPDKPDWQNKDLYPAMRVRPELEGSPCVFFDNGCKIHDIKSVICKEYDLKPTSFIIFDSNKVHCAQDVLTDKKRFAIDYAVKKK